MAALGSIPIPIDSPDGSGHVAVPLRQVGTEVEDGAVVVTIEVDVSRWSAAIGALCAAFNREETR
jgi:hypothetical protein